MSKVLVSLVFFGSIALPLLSAGTIPVDGESDWSQYHGNSGDRRSAESFVSPNWSKEDPKIAWAIETNLGFSSFVVSGDQAFTLVSGTDDGEGREVCIAVDVATGEELWSTGLGQDKYDGGGGRGASGNDGGDGPRSTPSVDDERVYVLGGALRLSALNRKSGELVWNQDIMADFGGRNIHWQNAASPLLVGDLVLMAGGGEGQSLLAFHRETGELAWKTGDETMTHATPILATIHGQSMAIFLVQSGLVALNPSDGAELWRQAFDYATSTAASPVVSDDIVYVSAGYGVGSATFRVVKQGDDFGTELIWRKRNKLINHWSTPVCRDGYLYGMFSFKKYGEGPMQCVELSTGEIKWSADGFGPGNCILVGETLVALSDAGEVVLAEATPDAYREQARAKVLAGKCWSSPSFSRGQLYVRSTTEGVRLDLSN